MSFHLPKKLLFAERILHIVPKRSCLVRVPEQPRDRLVLFVAASRSVALLWQLCQARHSRHSRATDLFQKTRRLKGVSEMLGHASTSTTARFYVRDSLTDDELFNEERL